MRDGCRSSKPVCCSALAPYSERQEALLGLEEGSRWRRRALPTAEAGSGDVTPSAMRSPHSVRGARPHRAEPCTPVRVFFTTTMPDREARCTSSDQASPRCRVAGDWRGPPRSVANDAGARGAPEHLLSEPAGLYPWDRPLECVPSSWSRVIGSSTLLRQAVTTMEDAGVDLGCRLARPVESNPFGPNVPPSFRACGVEPAGQLASPQTIDAIP